MQASEPGQVGMVNTYEGKGNADVKQIKVEGEWEKEKEVIVRHEVVSPKWEMWNYEDFSRRRNKAYRIRKREKILK
jgi:hypothetical protein